jgi:replicative DNA helicase
MKPRESRQALDAERALLGGLIEEPQQLADIDAMSVDLAADLASAPHQALYRLLRLMVAEGAAIDLVTVVERIRPVEGLYGGLGYVMDLASSVVSTANLAHYAGLIVEAARLRRLLEAGEALADAATGGQTPSGELATSTAARLLDVVQGPESRGWSEAWEGGADVLDHIDEVREGSRAPGLAFGLPSVDAHFPGGLEGNSYTLFLGRPAKGKTAAMLGLVESWAAQGVRCAVFSLEMSRRQLFSRTLSRMTGVPLGRMREPRRLTEGEVLRLRNAATLLRQWPLHIDDTPGVTMDAIKSKVRALKLRYPDLRVVATDYIQKVGSTQRMDERERIAAASWGHRMLAAEHDLVILSAAQLGRRADDVVFPAMSMIEGCSALEQDVTAAIAMLRPLPDDDRSNQDQATWYVLKQRDGAGEIAVPMLWDGATTSFRDPAASSGGAWDAETGSVFDMPGLGGGGRKPLAFPPRGRR